VDPRTSLEDVERKKILLLPGLELRPLRRPAGDHKLYPLPQHVIQAVAEIAYMFELKFYIPAPPARVLNRG
jgi:hypothetical protein